MVRLQARTNRHGAYFAGESVQVAVDVISDERTAVNVLTHIDDEANDGLFASLFNSMSLGAPAATKSTAIRVIAWTSVQIQALCTTPSHQRKAKQMNIDRSRTVVGEHGEPTGEFIFWNTEPVIVSCDRQLEVGERVSGNAALVIPWDMPPSYTGRSAGYRYRIRVGMQLVGESATYINVPVQIKSLLGYRLDISKIVEAPWRAIPSSPRIDNEKHVMAFPTDGDIHELITDVLSTSAARQLSLNKQRIFNIVVEGGSVCRVAVPKPIAYLGETMMVCLDFSCSEVPCYQVSAVLETVEECMADVVDSKSSMVRSVLSAAEHHCTTIGAHQLSVREVAGAHKKEGR